MEDHLKDTKTQSRYNRNSNQKSCFSFLYRFTTQKSKSVLKFESNETKRQDQNAPSFPKFDHKKKVLILDLDGTLTKVCLDLPNVPNFPLEFSIEGETVKMYAIPRPGLREFLAEMGQIYNLCIYTSADKEYAGEVLKSLGIINLFCAIYSRKYTYADKKDFHIKKISLLGYPLESTVFIDDCQLQMKHQPNNGIIIKKFDGDLSDQELINLIPFLRFLNQLDDVRSVSKHLIKFYCEFNKESAELEIVRLNSESMSEPIFVAKERKSKKNINSLRSIYSLDDPILRIKKSLIGLQKPSEKFVPSLFDFNDEKLIISNNEVPNSTQSLIEVGFKRINDSQKKYQANDNDSQNERD